MVRARLVGDALRRADVGLGVDADLSGGDVPQRRRSPGHVEAIELAADALDGSGLDRGGQRLVEVVGRQVHLEHGRQRRQPGLHRRIGVQLVRAPLGRLVGIADDRLREEEDLALVGVAPLLLHPGLEHIVVLLHLVDRLPGHDDGLGVAGREVLPRSEAPAWMMTGRPCGDGVALRGPRER